jgi:hypothetical protein
MLCLCTYVTFSFKKYITLFLRKAKVIQYIVSWIFSRMSAVFIHSYNQQGQTIVEVIEIKDQFNFCLLTCY